MNDHVMTSSRPQWLPPEEILDCHSGSKEAERLFKGIGQLDLARAQELIEYHFPSPPAVVFDVDGGLGVCSCWLPLEKRVEREVF